MRARQDDLTGRDIRLSHADSLRENFWLEKIEANLDSGRALVICGYLHVNILSHRVVERGAPVLEKVTLPAEMLQIKPEMVLDPPGLENYLEKLRAGRFYPQGGARLHSSETETR